MKYLKLALFTAVISMSANLSAQVVPGQPAVTQPPAAAPAQPEAATPPAATPAQPAATEPPAPAEQEPAFTGKIFTAKGNVQYLKAGTSVWLPVKAPQLINAGDRVKTGTRSSAEIYMRYGAKVRLHDTSIFVLREADRGQGSVELMVGKLSLWLRKVANRKFSIRTPAAVCAIRGSKIDMSADNPVVEDALKNEEALEKLADITPLSASLSSLQQALQAALQAPVETNPAELSGNIRTAVAAAFPNLPAGSDMTAVMHTAITELAGNKAALEKAAADQAAAEKLAAEKAAAQKAAEAKDAAKAKAAAEEALALAKAAEKAAKKSGDQTAIDKAAADKAAADNTVREADQAVAEL